MIYIFCLKSFFLNRIIVKLKDIWCFIPSSYPSFTSHIHLIYTYFKYISKYINIYIYRWKIYFEIYHLNNNFLSQIRHDKPLSTTNDSFVSEQQQQQQLVSSYENSLLPPPPQTCFIRSRSTFQFPVHICSNRVYQGEAERLRILSRCTRPPRDRDTDSIFPPPGIYTGNLSVCGG